VVQLLSWVNSNWFAVLQTVGILGSLWFTAQYFRQDSRTRQIANLLAMAERHEALWLKAQEDPKLSRILEDMPDLSKPPTTAEREFLNLIILHFQSGWRVARTTDNDELKSLSLDAGAFFRLPLPRAVWEKTKKFRNPKFVRFVERAMGK